MSPTVETQAWDSEFWGRRTARVGVSTSDAMPDVIAALSEAIARSEFVQVLVPIDRVDLAQAAESQGFRLVDVRCVVGRDLRVGAVTAPPAAARTAEPDELDAVAELSAACHTVSRFSSDPGLDRERVRDLYRRWIHRDAARPGWKVAVVGPVGRPAGYVTCGVEGDVGTIGVIGVDESARGGGLGATLLAAAHAWCVAQNATSMAVVTQAGNLPALAAYRRAGYSVGELGLWLHWHRPA